MPSIPVPGNMPLFIFSQEKKKERAGKCGLGTSTRIGMKLVFSYFLIDAKLDSNHKYKPNKIGNMKVGNTFCLFVCFLTFS